MATSGGRTRAERRPRVYREILLIAVCYSAYSFVRNLVPARHTAALGLGHDILHVERFAHVDVELATNKLFVDWRWLGVGANYYYATMHFVVTIGVLVWLYARHPDRYVGYRRLIFGTTVTALLGFWLFPLAPPRMLPGFVDTVLAFHTWGLYDSSPIAVLAVAYPLATVLVILGTANHYVLDAIGGAVVLGGGYLLTLAIRWTVPRLGPLAGLFSRV